MRIEIIAKNYKLGEKLKDIIEKKLEKFARYFEDDATAKVILREINQDKDAMEITVNFGGGKIMRAEVVSDNMYDNIDLVLPKLERQVRKYRTKLGKKVKESAFDMDALYSYSEAPIEELAVGRVKETDVRKMSVKEAISEMELLDHSFYVFINEANDLVNIVYRRAVGDVGLLDLIYWFAIFQKNLLLYTWKIKKTWFSIIKYIRNLDILIRQK